MQNKKKVILAVGDDINLEFKKDFKKDNPIPYAKAVGDGRICVIDRNCKEFITVGAIWKCVIVEILENKIIVTPITEILTRLENEKVKEENTQKLLANYTKEVKPKQPKIKKEFNYKSNNG